MRGAQSTTARAVSNCHEPQLEGSWQLTVITWPCLTQHANLQGNPELLRVYLRQATELMFTAAPCGIAVSPSAPSLEQLLLLLLLLLLPPGGSARTPCCKCA